MKAAAKKLPIHPLARLLPAMHAAEYAALKEDIARNGQRQPAILLDGQILDGRHRQDACAELGLPLKTEVFKGAGSPVWLVYSQAVHRNLTDSQKAAAAVEIEEELAREAAQRQKKTRFGAADAAGAAPGGGTGAPNGKARDQAGALFGVSGRYVQLAKSLRAADRKLFDSVKEGRQTLTVAVRESRRNAKRKSLALRAAALPALTLNDCQILTGKAEDLLPTVVRWRFRLIVADPPYNIAVRYGRYRDDRAPHDYLEWMCGVWAECARVLDRDGTLVVIINDDWAAQFVVYLQDVLGLHRFAWVKWYETFGVNCHAGFNRTSRHVLIYTAHPSGPGAWNPEAFTRPSARQCTYGDKRANPNGKLWDDVWVIPRLVDNAPERMAGFPTQLPLALVKPIVAGFSDLGDEVCDPFSGSGTTAVAAATLGRRFVGIELNDEYAVPSRTRVQVALAEQAAAAAAAKSEISNPKSGKGGK